MPLSLLLSVLAPPFCWECGAVSARGSPLCRDCRASLRWLPAEPVELDGCEAWAPVAYEGPARALVRALKFAGATAVAEAMAAQVAASLPAELATGVALVPVPLHPARERRRGFNQAERLAAAVSRRTGLEPAACLRRAGAATTQAGLPRSERLVALEGSYAVAPGAFVPSRALLVDDVITTGATLAACARALRAAGSETVAAIAYARTPTR